MFAYSVNLPLQPTTTWHYRYDVILSPAAVPLCHTTLPMWVANQWSLPTAMVATLSVYDASGRMVFEQEGSFTGGQNTIEIAQAKLSGAGIYYYTLTAGEYTATKKMILVR